MKIEEAIKDIRENIQPSVGGKSLEMAIEALEKQIPKNWIAEYIGDGEFVWKCPSCKEIYILFDGTPQDNKYNYCPNCGQVMAEQLNQTLV